MAVLDAWSGRRSAGSPRGRVLASFGDADPYAVVVAQRADEVAAEVRARLRASRDGLLQDGRPLQTYRRLTLERALALLTPAA